MSLKPRFGKTSSISLIPGESSTDPAFSCQTLNSIYSVDVTG